MSAFEDFVNLELPRRPAMLTEAITSYDGDPTDGGAPAMVLLAPKGSFFLQTTGNVLWLKNTATSGDWDQVGGGGGTPWQTLQEFQGGLRMYGSDLVLALASIVTEDGNPLVAPASGGAAEISTGDGTDGAVATNGGGGGGVTIETGEGGPGGTSGTGGGGGAVAIFGGTGGGAGTTTGRAGDGGSIQFGGGDGGYADGGDAGDGGGAAFQSGSGGNAQVGGGDAGNGGAVDFIAGPGGAGAVGIASGDGGAVNLTTGGAGTGGDLDTASAGALTLDTGIPQASGTAPITIGGTNAKSISIGRTGVPVNLSGGLGVGNAVAASTLGTVVGKAQVFKDGVSQGYLAIYDAIT